jgi:hypothetical protein
MKFKIGFTIESETLFRALAQFLPVDDLHVEEVAPLKPTAAAAVWRPTPSAIAKPVKPKQKRRSAIPFNLSAGINRIIMGIMSDGKPHKAVEFRAPLKANGFSENSVGSRLQALREHGVVEQMGDSTWRLAAAAKSA